MSGLTYTQRLADTIRHFGGATAYQASAELLRLEARVAELEAQELARLHENGAKAWAFLGDRSASDWVDEIRGNEPPDYGPDWIGAISSRVLAQPELAAKHLREYARLLKERQDCAPWGWAVVDKNGDDVKKRVRQINFFGAVNHQQEPLTQEDVTQADRDWPGLAPCRLVTLYAAPLKREPLSREKVRHLMSVAGYVDATQQEKADFINGVRFAEREHGIGGQS